MIAECLYPCSARTTAATPSSTDFTRTIGLQYLNGDFEVADEHGLEPDEMYEEDDQGKRREWLPERDNGCEDHSERKKWLVICRLKRKEV